MRWYRIIQSLALSIQTGFPHCRKAYSFLPVPGIFIISGFPVLHGCESMQFQDGIFTETTQSVPVKIAVHNTDNDMFGTLDIFVFNDDELKRLDCYQSINGPIEDGSVSVASQTGKKLLMACANTHYPKDDWLWVKSAASLMDFKVNIEDETLEYPSMSVSRKYVAGDGQTVIKGLEMSRISSEIVLRSISCDFKGRPYEGEKLTNAAVYLTNVCATYPIWGGQAYPERFINMGRLNEEDMSRLKDPGLIYAGINEPVGKVPYAADIHFRCYPNLSSAEGPGSVFTRLVIQGDISGKTWFWPININRGSDGTHEGIGRNMKYIYDIRITRKGSADPDTAVSTESISINTTINEWTEKEEYQVSF